MLRAAQGTMNHSVLSILLLPLTVVSVLGEARNFFFVTNTSYTTSTLNSSIFASDKLLGSMSGVTQQCRRNCALALSCQAFHVALTRGMASLGTFSCDFFAENACHWETTSIVATPLTPLNRLWEKLDLQPRTKPKACVQYCAVAYKGNCKACRGFTGLTGVDCDIAPRLCSDYQFIGWASALIWPWGFYGRSFYVSCYQHYTRILVNDCYATGTHVVGTISPAGWIVQTCNSASCLDATVAQTDWLTISHLVAIAPHKELIVFEAITIPNVAVKHVFSGFELTSVGELSLNSSVDDLPTGFPIPLQKAPFVPRSINCSAFWQFDNVSVCSQRTHILKYGSLFWNGVVGQGGLSILIA